MTRLRRSPVRDFGPKLRLTRAALGTPTQKELAAAFLARNPGTAFDLARSYKWLQGRTLPRSASLLAEWASLLDVGESHAWLAGCDLSAFAAALAKRYGRNASDLMHDAGLDAADDAAAPEKGVFVGGAFACYSHAQSPFYAGRIIRASLAISPPDRAGEPLSAVYTQSFADRTASARGSGRPHGPTLVLMLDDVPRGLAPIVMTLFLPMPPASLLAGLMMGAAALHPGLQPPYATRILAIRVPASAEAGLASSDRYLGRGTDDVVADLVALGVLDGFRDCGEVRGGIEACLSGGAWAGSDKLGVGPYLALATAFDRLWVDGLERQAAAPRTVLRAIAGELT